MAEKSPFKSLIWDLELGGACPQPSFGVEVLVLRSISRPLCGLAVAVPLYAR
jgi:hypothetical protein